MPPSSVEEAGWAVHLQAGLHLLHASAIDGLLVCWDGRSGFGPTGSGELVGCPALQPLRPYSGFEQDVVFAQLCLPI